ncbi:co-chaperone GroES [Candidatus Kaiserbacteria bacterium RIFOXYB1_FULL_46_14]|uniref:Co-chaperonin GroES n=1 Tax=Candidatus Kaiserbacteria bacterium RIFOXYB1_FULL_46_14 TaxID=1798531 RepID=A0A1F6FK17_9BACT|nr:MAG: co-chaperone GroES [Candidatus Kaiserbacteria bacterium RIFOXYB1_FULL_46_14]
MSEINIKPLADRVVVRPLTNEEAGKVSASGIIIPDTAKQEKPEQGIVVAIGAGKWDEDGEKRLPLEVKVGDRVVFRTWGEPTKIGDSEYWILAESDMLAIIIS